MKIPSVMLRRRLYAHANKIIDFFQSPLDLVKNTPDIFLATPQTYY